MRSTDLTEEKFGKLTAIEPKAFKKLNGNQLLLSTYVVCGLYTYFFGCH